MAPRQYMRKIKSGNPRFDDVYRAVTEYRQKYPDKAVTYFAKSYPEQAWAIFMAGGSLAGVPVRDLRLRAADPSLFHPHHAESAALST